MPYKWHFGTKLPGSDFWVNYLPDYPYLTATMCRAVIELGMRVTDFLEFENGHVY